MNKIIVEVGSTCTKVDKFDGDNIEKLEGKTIQFKKNYNEDKKLRESDIAEEIGAKYIVPTDIAMVYGILDEGVNR